MLTDEDESFWDFSWHEIGYYDLPAMINHILNTTKNDKLHYVGHSQVILCTLYFIPFIYDNNFMWWFLGYPALF